jgi:CxC2 like cysteine cluster associated with KDZ transposases
MVFILRNHRFSMQAFAFSLDMEVQSASLHHQDPSHSLWLMFQVGAKWITPLPGPIILIVIGVSGTHNVAIDFCDCRTNGTIPHHIQLLRAGWFPATFIRPQTAFTFHCLDFYHELTLQSKVNAYDFCRSLLRLTDSLELNKTSVCLFGSS